MADMATSVLARLKNKAAENGRSYQLCLQLFCQEEFLRRLEKSKYANNLVLKGGLFIYSITNFDSRVTVDVDFLLRKISNTPEQLKLVLEEIISCETGNDFTAPTVNTYSIETTVAEKLDAILNLMEFSSRMKDYYDIYYLANKFNFDGAILTEALKKTFANRNHTFTVEQFEQIMTYDADDGMQKKWKAFIKKIHTKTDDFKIVLETMSAFLKEPFIAAVDDAEYIKQWEAQTGEWR